jgi:hypothetical protein
MEDRRLAAAAIPMLETVFIVVIRDSVGRTVSVRSGGYDMVSDRGKSVSDVTQ